MRSFVTSLAVLSCVLVTDAEAKQYRFGSGMPETSNFIKESYEPLFTDLRDATGGSISLKGTYSGQIVSHRNALQGVRDGIVDAGHVVWIFHPAELPYTSLIGNMAPLAENMLATAGAMSELFLVACKECQDEYRKNNVMPLGAEPASAYHLMCTKKIETLADVKGLRIRAVGAMGQFAAELGGVPVNIQPAEMGQAMERGVIDCGFGYWEWVTQYSLKDFVTHVFEHQGGLGLGGSSLWFNRRVWNGFSDQERSAVFELLPQHLARTATKAYNEPMAAARAAAVAKGIRISDGGSNYVKAWDSYRHNSTAKDMVLVLEKRGVPKADAERFVASVVGVFDRWHKVLAPEFGEDSGKFQAVFRREVVTKVSNKPAN